MIEARSARGGHSFTGLPPRPLAFSIDVPQMSRKSCRDYQRAIRTPFLIYMSRLRTRLAFIVKGPASSRGYLWASMRAYLRNFVVVSAMVASEDMSVGLARIPPAGVAALGSGV